MIKSHLTPKNLVVHKENQLVFCQNYLKESFGGDGSSTFWVDIDKKNFYSFWHDMGKWMWQLKDKEVMRLGKKLPKGQLI